MTSTSSDDLSWFPGTNANASPTPPRLPSSHDVSLSSPALCLSIAHVHHRRCITLVILHISIQHMSISPRTVAARETGRGLHLESKLRRTGAANVTLTGTAPCPGKLARQCRSQIRIEVEVEVED